MSRMPKSLKSWLIPKLRRLSMYWPGKTLARQMASVKLKSGETKKGKPMFRTYFKCAECERQGITMYWTREETQVDHIIPIAGMDGFKSWDDYLEKLFCGPENLQIICIAHHEEKTKAENKQRKPTKHLTKRRK